MLVLCVSSFAHFVSTCSVSVSGKCAGAHLVRRGELCKAPVPPTAVLALGQSVRVPRSECSMS